jgi:hypothetical protein
MALPVSRNQSSFRVACLGGELKRTGCNADKVVIRHRHGMDGQIEGRPVMVRLRLEVVPTRGGCRPELRTGARRAGQGTEQIDRVGCGRPGPREPGGEKRGQMARGRCALCCSRRCIVVSVSALNLHVDQYPAWPLVNSFPFSIFFGTQSVVGHLCRYRDASAARTVVKMFAVRG